MVTEQVIPYSSAVQWLGSRATHITPSGKPEEMRHAQLNERQCMLRFSVASPSF